MQSRNRQFLRLYNESKISIREQLNTIEASEGGNARLKKIQEEIGRLSDEVEQAGLIRRYLYVLYELLWIESSQKKVSPRVRQLVKLAQGILMALGISPGDRNFGFLFGDIHSVVSQIYWRSGKTWVAAWEQHLAVDMTKSHPSRESGFGKLCFATRVLQLGDATQALTLLEQSVREGLSPDYVMRARILSIRCLSLQGRNTEAKAVALRAVEELQPQGRHADEIQWEIHLAEARITKDILPLIRACGKGGTHHEAAYIVETFFWIRASSSTEWIRKFPTLRSLVKSSLQVDCLEGYYNWVKLFEWLESESVPLSQKLLKLNGTIEEVLGLPHIDKRLLILAGLARWLARNRQFSASGMLLSEYQSLALRLSLYQDSDVLGCMSDLLSKSWFLGRLTNALAA